MIKKGMWLILALVWIGSSSAMEQNWEDKFEKVWGNGEKVERVIRQLVAQADDLNFTFNKGRTTPLSAAILHKSKEGVKLLLDKGANINRQTSQGLTPLHFAVATLDAPMVSYLLERGANPTIASNAGLTPLAVAQANNYRAVIDILSKAPVQPTQKEPLPSPVKPTSASALLFVENKTNSEYVIFDPLKRERKVVEPQGSLSMPLTLRSYNKASLKSTIEVYGIRNYQEVETAIKYRKPTLSLTINARRDLGSPKRLKVSSVVEHKLEPSPKGVINRSDRTVAAKEGELGFNVELTLRGINLERSTAKIVPSSNDDAAAIK